MYEKRVKVFIGVSLAVLLVCMLRLVQMQLLTSPELQDEIAKAHGAAGSVEAVQDPARQDPRPPRRRSSRRTCPSSRSASTTG